VTDRDLSWYLSVWAAAWALATFWVVSAALMVAVGIWWGPLLSTWVAVFIVAVLSFWWLIIARSVGRDRRAERREWGACLQPAPGTPSPSDYLRPSLEVRFDGYPESSPPPTFDEMFPGHNDVPERVSRLLLAAHPCKACGGSGVDRG
jgi:hypothetical protein